MAESKAYEQKLGGYRKYKDTRTNTQKVTESTLFKELEEEYHEHGEKLTYEEGVGFKVNKIKTLN